MVVAVLLLTVPWQQRFPSRRRTMPDEQPECTCSDDTVEMDFPFYTRKGSQFAFCACFINPLT